MTAPDATLPRIALALGDCTGIGPEICAKVLHDGRLRDTARIVVVGDRRVLEQGMRDAGVSVPVAEVASPADADWAGEAVPFVDLGNIDPSSLPRGQVSPDSGRLTGDTLARAIAFAQAGEVDAVSFAPLNKAAMHAGGWRFPDEHKMFANLLRHEGYFSEMNVLDGQWMSRVTSHVSLRQALDQITPRSIEDAIRLVDRTMRRAGVERPRIAVAALNPHAGENGLFGMEEIEMIGPTVKAVAATGIDCRGPFPADTIYLKAFAGDYDSVVAMYHDQGQIATKLRGFNRGVTVTAGLDTVFTTPAHGTAFDIVGQGVASRARWKRRSASRPASRRAPNAAARRRPRLGSLSIPPSHPESSPGSTPLILRSHARHGVSKDEESRTLDRGQILESLLLRDASPRGDAPQDEGGRIGLRGLSVDQAFARVTPRSRNLAKKLSFAAQGEPGERNDAVRDPPPL